MTKVTCTHVSKNSGQGGKKMPKIQKNVEQENALKKIGLDLKKLQQVDKFLKSIKNETAAGVITLAVGKEKLSFDSDIKQLLSHAEGYGKSIVQGIKTLAAKNSIELSDDEEALCGEFVKANKKESGSNV